MLLFIACALPGVVFGFYLGLLFIATEEHQLYLRNYLSLWKFDYFSSHERNIIDEQYSQRAKIFLDFYKAKKPWWRSVDPVELHWRFKQEGLWSPWDIYQNDIWKSTRLRGAVSIEKDT